MFIVTKRKLSKENMFYGDIWNIWIGIQPCEEHEMWQVLPSIKSFRIYIFSKYSLIITPVREIMQHGIEPLNFLGPVIQYIGRCNHKKWSPYVIFLPKEKNMNLENTMMKSAYEHSQEMNKLMAKILICYKQERKQFRR